MARTSRRRPGRLEKWQAVVAAVIAAVATVVVALIQTSGKSDRDDPSETSNGSIAIGSGTFETAAPPLLVQIVGKASGLGPSDDIRVVAQPKVVEEQGSAPWFASGAASLTADGLWQAHLELPADVFPPLTFVAVIYPGGRNEEPYYEWHDDGGFYYQELVDPVLEQLEASGPAGLVASSEVIAAP